MSKKRTGERFVPRVEGLEDRVVPAGNVFVSVFEGVLYVGGDDAGNAVRISGDPDDRERVTISALDATTTFNGQRGPLVLDGIDLDIYVRMHGGDDRLVIENVSPRRKLDVGTGDGNDSLTITGATPRKETILTTGNGNDDVFIGDSTFRRYMSLDTGAGDDIVIASRVSAMDFGVFNPSGSDFFENRNSTLVRPALTNVTVGAPPPDETAPTPTLTSSSADPSRTAPLLFNVTFDEDVTGFDAADLMLVNATVGSFTPTDARNYSFTLTPTADGPVSATVSAGGATDASGNANVASETVTRTFDTTGPTVGVTRLTTTDTTPVISGTVGEADATVSVVVNGQTYSAAVGGTVWAANVTNPLADGTYAVTVTATDALGNSRTFTDPTGLTVDATAPTATFSVTPDPITNQTTVLVRIEFNEDVNNFTAADITAANGSKGTFTAVSARVYTIQVSSNRDGTVVVSIPEGAGSDAAGNGTQEGSFNLNFDTGAPTLNLASGSDSGPDGDLRTDLAAVDLTGVARPGATVQLFAANVPGTPGSGTLLDTVVADGGGVFTFMNVALAVGANSFTARATDTSSVVSNTFSQTFVRNTAPTVLAPIADQTATVGTNLTFDLASSVFADAETVVRFATTYPNGQTSNLDINLFDATPDTTANFLAYVNASSAAQSYDGSVFHRKLNDFILQGGGFKFVDSGTTTATAFPAITEFAAIDDEFANISNTRGTIAMAKPGAPDTATSEFFFNLDDNSVALDSAANAGGFAVFGQVMNGGLAVIDGIAGLDEYNGSGLPGAPPFPVSATADTDNFPANINAADVALITTARELTAAQRMTFTVDDPNPAVATASITNGVLTIVPVASGGPITFTIRATDLDGSFTETTVVVTVS